MHTKPAVALGALLFAGSLLLTSCTSAASPASLTPTPTATFTRGVVSNNIKTPQGYVSINFIPRGDLTLTDATLQDITTSIGFSSLEKHYAANYNMVITANQKVLYRAEVTLYQAAYVNIHVAYNQNALGAGSEDSVTSATAFVQAVRANILPAQEAVETVHAQLAAYKKIYVRANEAFNQAIDERKSIEKFTAANETEKVAQARVRESVLSRAGGALQDLKAGAAWQALPYVYKVNNVTVSFDAMPNDHQLAITGYSTVTDYTYTYVYDFTTDTVHRAANVHKKPIG